MQKIFFSFFIFSMLYLFTGTSCTKKIKSVENEIRFDSIRTADTYYLSNDTALPACNIRINFIYPDSANVQQLQLLQQIFIETTFDDSFLHLEPQQVPEEFSRQYVNEFQQVEIPDPKTYPEEETIYENETGFFCYIKLSDKILFNQNGFLSFIVETTNYRGGAYNSKDIKGYVINLKTGKLLQEEDFAGMNFKQNMSSVFAKKIAEANELDNPEDLENIGYYNSKEILPNNNFTIDNKGITYYFNENEIAGTLVGLTRVFVPYGEINIYMKKEHPFSFLH